MFTGMPAILDPPVAKVGLTTMRRFDDHGQYNMLYFNYLTRFLPDTKYSIHFLAMAIVSLFL